MKKILNLLSVIIFTLALSFTVFANDWVNLKLNYDGKIHNYSAEKVHITIDSKEIEQLKMEPIIIDGRTLVPLRDVFEEMGAEILWDDKKKEVTIKKDDNTIIFKIGSKEAIKNSIDVIKLDVPAKIINGYTMVPIRAISDSIGCSVEWDNNIRTIIIETPINNITTTTETITEVTTNNIEPVANQKQDGIKIVWDQTNKSINDSDIKRKAINGLDVLSPTWFEIKNSKGDIEDKGSIEYSKWAKEQGYQLWGLVSNSFDKIITHDTLSDPNKRSKIINTLLEYAKKYNLDGINIDFENVAKEDGDYYLQFIKEATSIFKQNGLVVSVDMYVPAPWTAHYQMKEVAKIVDYVIIMAYDEHYSTSKESGSVSSLPWAEKYMVEATKLVPKDKLIMGVPFYTRVWTETKKPDGTVSVVSKSLKMEEARKLLEDNNANIVWNEKTKQYYGEYFSDGTTKKIWLEDEKSMEERMKLARKLDVKGIAAWKRGHETDATWDIINKYFK
ncbi:glycosyl hydrolase family 18 protein [uncultured Tyzzerella sp.]|uniref:stalk domain-containing protein n=1 Tax=uncultured Tyzzerella sp. TaxID=2321398 RepID=UPI0029425019|nr:glycosyl hydrolase family 18 protein [uncultured Tyzzerella sp.]